jgi:hypothetical protein
MEEWKNGKCNQGKVEKWKNGMLGIYTFCRLATGNYRLATADWQLPTGVWQLPTGVWQLPLRFALCSLHSA